MRRKTHKVSVRLSDKEADLLGLMQYHCCTHTPSGTLRFALKVLGLIEKHDLSDDNQKRIIDEFSAQTLLDRFIKRKVEEARRRESPTTPALSDKPTPKKRTPKPSTMFKNPLAKHGLG